MVIQQNNERKTTSTAEQAAISRLAAAIPKALVSCGTDLIIKMFADLDTVFFGGLLRGRVRVSWSTREDYAKIAALARDGGASLALCQWLKPGFCQISLSAEKILRYAEDWNLFEVMWATLLHEMSVS